MGINDFKLIVKAIKSVYGNNRIADQQAFNIWFDLLKDLDYTNASRALQRHMSTSKYPPTIADIREQYRILTQPNEMTGMEAWSLVSKAIRNGIYGYEDEFARFPDLVQKAVGSPEQLYIWATDEDYNEGVTRSNFLRSYDMAVEKEKENSQLPEKMREMIGDLGRMVEG